MRCLVSVLALSVCSCALLSKGEPTTMRYFVLESLPASSSKTKPNPLLVVRLAQVKSADDLRERIAFRPSVGELRYYENRSWTERPAAYLARALSRALFEEHRFTMALSGSAPTLAVELTSFEEIRASPHRVRLEATMVLEDGEVALHYETLRVEQPVLAGGEDLALALVEAFSNALGELVQQIVQRTQAALLKHGASDSQ